MSSVHHRNDQGSPADGNRLSYQRMYQQSRLVQFVDILLQDIVGAWVGCGTLWLWSITTDTVA